MMLKLGTSSRLAVRTRATAPPTEAPASDDKKSLRAPRKENVSGSFFVDHTCIDCDTCRWMAPKTFTRVNDQSAVYKQPKTEADTVRAYQALLSCPTYSIHATDSQPAVSRAARDGMPTPVAGAPNVYHCGWHAENTFGGAAYLIVRPQGNILVDSPRYNPVLVKHIQALGGIKTMFLTHRDDVGDHAKWHKKFGCQRIIHNEEVEPGINYPGTKEVEIKLEGEGPWKLDDSDDLEVVFTPGHTKAHCILYYKPAKALFSGDHVSQYKSGENYDFEMDEPHNWYSIPLQRKSIQKLANLGFLHILPCHGRPVHFQDDAERIKGYENFTKRNDLEPISA